MWRSDLHLVRYTCEQGRPIAKGEDPEAEEPVGKLVQLWMWKMRWNYIFKSKLYILCAEHIELVYGKCLKKCLWNKHCWVMGGMFERTDRSSEGYESSDGWTRVMKGAGGGVKAHRETKSGHQQPCKSSRVGNRVAVHWVLKTANLSLLLQGD